MSSVEELIWAVVDAKQGNKELCLYRHDNDRWTAEIGNPLTCVLIGEGPAEFAAEADTIRGALTGLLDIVTMARLKLVE